MENNISKFGEMPDGETVHCIALSGGGLKARILTYGATVQDLRLEGVDHPLVLGAPTLAPYFGPFTYFGALVGRFANRIAQGRFSLDGTDYQITRKTGDIQALHGGETGTGQRNWTIADVSTSHVCLRLVLADGDMGFPGELTVLCDIRLTQAGGLSFDISATTTQATPCSFAHHSYFNLDDSPEISDHSLQVDAAHYLPVDDGQIPTGEIKPVAGTKFDFQTAETIGQRGLDHNFCLTTKPVPRKTIRDVAILTGKTSGVSMRVATDQPGLQVYDAAGFPKSGLSGLEGRRYGPFAGLALETQAWPDAPNHPQFPNAVLRSDETYRHHVSYHFSKAR
ncbi:aldose 1-epimerase [Pacificibacter maritimus]|uniref:Aldose 1-epimerase n=1 Tax=Pacificibacter maritimus TaxID=762213 RepID=A0A3N4V2N7_9RHOB|nr:aldose epimerase family protein [Pacificibacter maritimus]RPE71357.1 aldose 1-epimerase [Pacificibacter maritimus]